PLLELKALMQRIAGNDLKGAIPGLGRHDEIGDMARTIEIFRNNAIERQDLEAAGEAMREQEGQRNKELEKLGQEIKATRAQEADRNNALEHLIDKFRGIVTRVISSLGNETAAMRGAAGALGNVARNAADKASKAASASQGAAGNAQTVAVATEE